MATGGRESAGFVFAGLYGMGSGLFCLTYADVIMVMLHTEENTRASAQFLARLADRLDPTMTEERPRS
jgi:hypothetical protein